MEQPDKAIYDDYVALIKREAALTSLLDVVAEMNADGSTSASTRSDMLKYVSKAYSKLNKPKV